MAVRASQAAPRPTFLRDRTRPLPNGFIGLSRHQTVSKRETWTVTKRVIRNGRGPLANGKIRRNTVTKRVFRISPVTKRVIRNPARTVSKREKRSRHRYQTVLSERGRWR